VCPWKHFNPNLDLTAAANSGSSRNSK